MCIICTKWGSRVCSLISLGHNFHGLPPWAKFNLFLMDQPTRRVMSDPLSALNEWHKSTHAKLAWQLNLQAASQQLEKGCWVFLERKQFFVLEGNTTQHLRGGVDREGEQPPEISSP